MHPVDTFELVLALLAVVVALHWLAQRIGLPRSVALLVGGGALVFVSGLPPMNLNPELPLVLFLPPLVMDGAAFLDRSAPTVEASYSAATPRIGA
jgi:CPA1 family monovalent cation:H+ antiporter